MSRLRGQALAIGQPAVLGPPAGSVLAVAVGVGPLTGSSLDEVIEDEGDDIAADLHAMVGVVPHTLPAHFEHITFKTTSVGFAVHEGLPRNGFQLLPVGGRGPRGALRVLRGLETKSVLSTTPIIKLIVRKANVPRIILIAWLLESLVRP
jgi:hypothetical protein